MVEIGEILERHNCQSIEQLYSKLKSLTVKFERDLHKMIPRWEEFKEKILDAPLLNYLEHLRAFDDAEKEIKKDLADLAKKGEAPLNCIVSDLTPVDDVYTATLLFKKWECGMDFPGNYLNPLGLGYFNEFFNSMYLGNYQDFLEIINDMSKYELDVALKQRVGYLQVTPVFVPIIGLKMVNFDNRLSDREVDQLRLVFPRVEGQHLEILQKLLELGVDVNAVDFIGCSPIFHCYNTDVADISFRMAKLLQEHGLDPNISDRSRATILWLCAKDDMINFIDLLISYKADQNTKIPKASGHDMTILQWTARNGSLKAFQSLIGVRKLVEQKSLSSTWMRGEGKVESNVQPGISFSAVQEMQSLVIGEVSVEDKCWSCGKMASKKCSGCSVVWYCSTACQKTDWIRHKLVCRFFNGRKKSE